MVLKLQEKNIQEGKPWHSFISFGGFALHRLGSSVLMVLRQNHRLKQLISRRFYDGSVLNCIDVPFQDSQLQNMCLAILTPRSIYAAGDGVIPLL
jgi:hypothetical protein